MTHPERDEDLLGLVHGQLPLWRRPATRWHLRRCAGCRRRQAEFRTASRALAGAFRGPLRLAWVPPGAARPATAAARLLVAVALLLVMAAGTLAVRSLHRAPCNPSVSVGGCRPDLPNDRCR